MPTYNRADLLPQSIESILSQDFMDLELIVVDDGSTDNTSAVMARIQQEDARVVYVPLPENRGIGFARDAGLPHCSGRYIALSDSDDLWLPGKLSEQVQVLEAYPEIEILFGDFVNIDYVGGTEGMGFAQTRPGIKHLSVRSLGQDLWIVDGGVETGILRANFIATPTMLLRKEVFDKIGSFNTTLTPTDHEFCWRAAVLGIQFAYISHPLIERYRYASSSTASIFEIAPQLLDALRICRQTCEAERRYDLRSHIQEAEQREWRKLIWEYGRNRMRLDATKMFLRSLGNGFSLRTFVFFVTALGGPWLIDLATSVRSGSA
jgi:glycosyltransferase involved in cell wall biosynthesis